MAIVLGLVALLVAVGTVAGAFVAVIAAHHHVEAAADLAALGGAGAVGAGQDPCAVAEAIARRNGATTQGCEVRGSEVWIAVSLRLPEILGGRVLHARARAGPA